MHSKSSLEKCTQFIQCSILTQFIHRYVQNCYNNQFKMFFLEKILLLSFNIEQEHFLKWAVWTEIMIFQIVSMAYFDRYKISFWYLKWFLVFDYNNRFKKINKKLTKNEKINKNFWEFPKSFVWTVSETLWFNKTRPR